MCSERQPCATAVLRARLGQGPALFWYFGFRCRRKVRRYHVFVGKHLKTIIFFGILGEWQEESPQRSRNVLSDRFFGFSIGFTNFLSEFIVKSAYFLVFWVKGRRKARRGHEICRLRFFLVLLLI